MMDDSDCRVREVAWAEACPWLCLFRAFRLAIGVRLLLLAAVAMLLTGATWALIDLAFSGNERVGEQIACPWIGLADLVPDKPSLPSSLSEATDRSDPLVGSWQLLSKPFLRIFSERFTVANLAYQLLRGLSALAIWAFFGAAITRTVAVQLAAEQRLGWSKMFGHCTTKWKAYFAAPLFPLAGMLLIILPMFVGGLLLRANFGVFLAAIVWPLMLVAGLLIAVLALGLAFGWPLMWATISAEGTDSFDALSRSYAYVFQRPLHYLFYVVVAGALGLLGWMLVYNFAALVIDLTYWGASWGSASIRIDYVINPDVEAARESLQSVGVTGARLIGFWCQCVKVLAAGYLFSYFWTATTAIYFLLRRDVDATETDEIALEEDEDDQSYGLPPLKTDEFGAPVVADQADDEVENDLADEE